MRSYSLTIALTLALAVLPAVAQPQQQVTVPYQGTVTAPAQQVTAPAQNVPYNGNLSITIPAGCILTGTVVTCGVVPPPTGCPPVGTTARTKLTPSGGNDQPAIWAAATRGPICVTCPTPAPCTFQVQQSAQNNSVPTNADIWFDDKVTVTDGVAYTGWAHMFPVSGVTNVSLAGSGSQNAATLQMPLTFAQDHISNNIVWIGTSTGVVVTGLRFDRSGEDSVYIGSGATNVHLSNVVSTNPARNGCSVTDKVTNIEIDHSDFSLAKNLAGGIADGCDFEPNGPAQGTPIAGQFVKAVNFHDNNVHDNAGDGLCLCMYFIAPSTPVDYTLTNNKAARNGWKDYDPSSFPTPMNVLPKQSGNSWQTAAQAKRKPTVHPTVRLY